MEKIELKNQNDLIFEQAYFKALLENKKNLTQWKEYKEKYQEVINNLKYYLEKHQHAVLLPVGNKAFVKGTLIHTNDVWVTLGCGWFLKTSSRKAIEICERRIKSADELIEKWEKENKLLESMKEFRKGKDTFESEGSKDIVEPFDEEKEKQWKLEHREKEKKYRQKLKELREKTNSPSLNTEKDIWEHLEALELQEELEDELNRLGYDSETSSEDDDNSDNEIPNNKIDSNDPIKESATVNEELQEIKNISIPSINKITTKKKTVTFNLPSDHKTLESREINEKVIENTKFDTSIESKEVNAVSDTVHETMTNQSRLITNKNETRPISKFKMNRKSTT